MKTAAKKRAPKKSGALKVTATGLTIKLTAAQKRKAQACIRETGKITLGFQEVESTKLTDLANASVTVN
jgi:hypothetical protein